MDTPPEDAEAILTQVRAVLERWEERVRIIRAIEARSEAAKEAREATVKSLEHAIRELRKELS